MTHRAVHPWMCIVACALAGLLAGCASTTDQDDVDRSEIGVDEVRALVETIEPKAALILDAREPRAFAAGHIPGARQIPSHLFSGRRGETDPALEAYDAIVVYADNPGSGAANGLAMQMMSTGYTNVRMFTAGFDAWRRAGRPVSTGGPLPDADGARSCPDIEERAVFNACSGSDLRRRDVGRTSMSAH